MVSFVIFALLWVSSHLLVVFLNRDTGSNDVAIASLPGELNWIAHERPQRRKTNAQWNFGTERITKDWKYPIHYNGKPMPSTIGFRWKRTTNELLVSIPYWFLIAMSAIGAAAPRAVPWSSRFSLRTLLTVTTLVAIVLGLIVAFR
jgi:hypothetical protein